MELKRQGAPRPRKHHGLLRGYMMENDYTEEELAELIGVSTSSVGRSLNYKQRGWTTFEMYKIMDQFGIDHSRMHEIFPPAPEPVDLKLVKTRPGRCAQ